MEFLYHPNPTSKLVIEGEKYHYLFKVRRTRSGDVIPIRNLKDDNLFFYKVEEVKRRKGILNLEKVENRPVLPSRFFHLGWCVVDPKTVEKGLPPLNEMGVSKISFIYCSRSQRNFRLRLERINRILIESAQQCGRSRLPEVEIVESLERFLSQNRETVGVDFKGESLTDQLINQITTVVVGPEGGFTSKERSLFKGIVGLKGFILKSETAVWAITAKILL